MRPQHADMQRPIGAATVGRKTPAMTPANPVGKHAETLVWANEEIAIAMSHGCAIQR